MKQLNYMHDFSGGMTSTTSLVGSPQPVSAVVRKAQIDLITDQPNAPIDWIRNLMDEITIVQTVIWYPDAKEVVYYKKGVRGVNQFIFYRCDDRGTFWCSKTLYWEVLIHQFNLMPMDVRDITNFFMEGLNPDRMGPLYACHSTTCDTINDVLKKFQNGQ